MVITEAAADAVLDIRHLVYLSAAVPDSGQSLESLARSLGLENDDDRGEDVNILSDGQVQLTPEAARASLFHDCAARVSSPIQSNGCSSLDVDALRS